MTTCSHEPSGSIAPTMSTTAARHPSDRRPLWYSLPQRVEADVAVKDVLVRPEPVLWPVRATDARSCRCAGKRRQRVCLRLPGAIASPPAHEPETPQALMSGFERLLRWLPLRVNPLPGTPGGR